MSNEDIKQNINNARRQNAVVNFTRLKDIMYKAVSYSLPESTIAFNDFTAGDRKVLDAGSVLTFGPLTITFIADEDLSNWITMLEWQKVLASGKDKKGMFSLPGDIGRSRESDCTIFILSNALNTQGVTLTYTGVKLETLGSLEYGYDDEQNPVVKFTCNFVVEDVLVGTPCNHDVPSDDGIAPDCII